MLYGNCLGGAALRVWGWSVRCWRCNREQYWQHRWFIHDRDLSELDYRQHDPCIWYPGLKFEIEHDIEQSNWQRYDRWHGYDGWFPRDLFPCYCSIAAGDDQR